MGVGGHAVAIDRAQCLMQLASPAKSRPSIDAAPVTTWLFVRMNPSGVKRNPEPPPRRFPRDDTSGFTTGGMMRAAAEVTAVE